MNKMLNSGSNMAHKRVFFALQLSTSEKQQFKLLQDQQAAFIGSTVAKENFHLTLAFIGSVNELTLDTLIDSIQSPSIANFSLDFQPLAFYPKAKVGCVEPLAIPKELVQLQKYLVKRVKSIKPSLIKTHQTFRPHISLYRNCQVLGDMTTKLNNINLSVSHFVLMESVPLSDGVFYRVLEEWPLKSLSVKEQWFKQRL